jgi:hypothetical protein
VTSEKGVLNTITMTAEEKKAMRAEIEKTKKAAKKRKAEEDRKRRLVEEAERARVVALEFLGARAKEWTPWATITHFAVDLQGFVSVDGERAAPANAVRNPTPACTGLPRWSLVPSPAVNAGAMICASSQAVLWSEANKHARVLARHCVVALLTSVVVNILTCQACPR